MKTPLISFVTHGRNDGFMGDFLWRVSTCINQIARSYAALGRLDDIEILVGDWGSEQKTLREAVTLEPAARRVTRFCTVPPTVAARLNRDGHYAYSPAANIPIRRANGKFIFSMDSDAWMPLKTAEYLLQIADGKNPTGLDLDKSFFWASRQHIPFSFVATSPSIEELDRYLVEQREKLFWTGKCNLKEFRGGAVAIFGKREHFHAIRGYNEALVHWGWQDIDIHCRMAMLFAPHDLWDFGAEMFHLEHYPKRGGAVAGGRKISPQIVPTEPIVNGLDWGAGNDLVDVSAAPNEIQPAPAKAENTGRPRNIVISGTNFWNPGDDFVRDGIIRVLQNVFPNEPLNFLFYNFNADFFPQAKFAGIGNYISKGDLEKYRDFVDAVVIAGLSAGDEIKDLYRWVVANGLAEKVYLIGAGYENDYVAKHISQEPEATIFRKARIVTGRTAKTPEFIRAAGIPYRHINCPAILSVPEVKKIAAGHKIQRIGFSIQLPHGEGVVNHSCARQQYDLSVAVLRDLARSYAVEVIAHHKTEYFHFLNLLRGENIPVIFSSFYQDLHQLYPRYDLVVTTRLHSSLFANGHGIPGIIINDTDRHTHTLDGFLHSFWVNTRENFDKALAHWMQADLAAIASELGNFKSNLLAQYIEVLRPMFKSEVAPAVEVSTLADSLPVHFFTIVLNGNPYIRHHIEQMCRLPFRWHWHIVEGVAELNHDTAWSKATGGKVSAELHRNGLSVDGTTEYLDALKREFPKNITIYRPPAGKFWDGKREMVNAPLANISEGCLLWQVDADELWTFSQMIRMRAMFVARPEKSAAYFFCHYFVGPKLVITSRDTYGNNSSYEWLRVWRYQPGDHWVAHEPPRLHRGELDVAFVNAFRHAETEAMGLVFQHYAYATEAQIHFKEAYYGYAGAVEQWHKLQKSEKFPQRLANHFAWVKDEAMVNTAESSGIKKLVTDEWLGEVAEKPVSVNLPGGPERILFVRTDAIGDAVLASSMLEPIRKKYPQAKLAVLCQQYVADVYVASPFVDAVICFEQKKMDVAAEREQILAEIAVFKPDLILNSIRSRFTLSDDLTLGFPDARHIAIESDGINQPAGDRAKAAGRYAQIIPSPGEWKPELERHRDFLNGLGIEVSRLEPAVWTSSDDEILADAFFRQQKLDPMRTLALFPYTQHELKNYPSFANALKSFADWNILILGGPESKGRCEQLARQLPGKVLNLAGCTSLREMAAIIRRCRILIGSDTCGPHIACAVGVPNVVVLSGGHGGRFVPYSSLTSVVTLPLDCFGCNQICRFSKVHCVKDLDPTVVAEAMRETLAAQSARPRIFCQGSSRSVVEPGGPRWRLEQPLFDANDAEFITVGGSLKEPSKTVSRTGPSILVPRSLPKISIVTPSFNQGDYLDECMDSILSQNYPNLEYIVMDGGSKDRSVEIIQRHAKHLVHWQSQPDGGQYHAIQDGLDRTTGEIMFWLNSSDKLHPGSLDIVSQVFAQRPNVEWIMGHPSGWNEAGLLTDVSKDIPLWSRELYLTLQPRDKYIQQESTFWRRSLWSKSGSRLDLALKHAADFELWARFFHFAPLHSMDALLGGFRSHTGQKTAVIMRDYVAEVDQVVKRELQLLRREPTPKLLPAPPLIDIVGLDRTTSRITPKNFSYFTYSKQPHFSFFRNHDVALYGRPADPADCDLKVYQDLLAYTFIKDNIPPGSKILDIGGGDSRVLRALKNEYECWNLDKLEGVGNGLKAVDASGYRLVKDYIGNFNPELPKNYFDFVFSISVFEHLDQNEENFRKVCLDLDRIMKPGAYSLHCLDVVQHASVWTNKILPFMFENIRTTHSFIPLEQLRLDPHTFHVSATAYDRLWKVVTKKSYEEFGRPLSYNLLWQKTDKTFRRRLVPATHSSTSGPVPAVGIEAYLMQLEKALTKEDFATAEKILREAHAAFPTDAGLVTALANLQFQRGQYKDAIPNYRTACRLNPKDASLPVLLAKACEKANVMDEIEPAIPAANAAQSACPVCRTLAPAVVVKKDQVYHQCPSCECVFTPRIDAAVIQTENSGNSGRHDQNHDLIRLQRVMQTLGRKPEQMIDFGCGQGETTRFLQSQGIQVVGIDQDTPVQLDDVAEASVDGIMMVEVIEHLYNPHAIFQQFNRVLKPGGVAYIESSFADKRDLANWGYLDPAIGHSTVHTLRSMAVIAEKNGFKLQWLNPNVCFLAKQVTVIPAEKGPAVTTPVEVIGEGIPDPIVSVVVSTYKAEKFIRPCLENLSRQKNFERCEVIVVDSGSPENERAIVLELQQKFPNLRYVRTERETIYGAWNCGLALARGRYWVNANTDDAMRDDALEILTAALDKHADCALAYADTAWTTQPNDRFPSVSIVRTVKYPDYTPVETMFYCVTGCLQFWRTQSLRQLGGFDASLRAAGDYEATLKLMAARMNAVHIPEVLSLFYQNTSGLTQGDNGAAAEHLRIMHQFRANLDISNIFKVNAGDPASVSLALAALASRCEGFSVPWEDKPFEHIDFALGCYSVALDLNPQDATAGIALCNLYRKCDRLAQERDELTRRWPHLKPIIERVMAGEKGIRPNAQHAVFGPVYRPFELAKHPTTEQLSREPAALRPWICRIEGRHVYLSEELFPRPTGLRYEPEELQTAAKRLAMVLADLPPFHAHFGGAGDALLLLASFYDQKPDAVVFSHPNGVGAAKALFDAFPKISKIYFLPQHAEPYFHIVLRFMVYELRNCLGSGTTPKADYIEEWKATLDIEKKYRIKKSPRWAADFCQNQGSRKVAVAPKGSLSGMVGSKRNIILPEQWPLVIAHIVERGFEPVILGVPNEAKDYPALPGCVDARGETFPGQMKIIGQCAGLVGADSWAKTFSALANIPTIVFEPLKGADLCTWKDASDWVFIEPWPAIKMVQSLDGFRRAFDARIAKISVETPATKAVIAWEGSFLDYGSLSHVNRELTSHLAAELNLTCVGSNALNAKTKADLAMQRCAKKLFAKAPANVAVTIRHQWPPNWSKPASGALVVIQPWEYGALPKAWVANEQNVDEFWVPSPLVRAMYLNSGIAPEKVRVVPNGVDLKKFRPGVRPLALPTKKKFKFLFVGGTIYRKGPDILLEAFTQAFTSADDVCLVVKDFGGDSFYQGQTAEAAIHALQQKPGAPEIIYLKDELASEQMPSLYAACDCFVLPYRGEGFGMPVLEAMACGLPVIVTANGATESFVTDEAGWKISSQLIRLGDRVGNIPLVKNGWMFEPGKAHLMALFKQAAGRPEECRKRGANGRAVAEKRFDWSDISAMVAHRLKELAANAPVTPSTPTSSGNVEKRVVAQLRPVQVPEVAHVGQLAEARELFGQKKLQAAWEAAVMAIAHRPFHPEAGMLLAEIALAAGDSRSARTCAEYTRKVAPGWNAPKQFLKKSLKGNAKLEWLKLPETLNSQLSTLNLKLTVCLIAKNEEKFLAQCLKSVRDIAQQIIVVDTGSTDRTVEIAREFNAEVYSHPWNDDFAAARNAALEHATGDWVLVLDADEELPVAQHGNLLADLKKSEALAHRLPLANAGEDKQGRSFVPRLFRNAPGIFYQGRIHEQVFPSLLPQSKTWGLKTSLGTAEILHHGYSKEMVRDRNKIERNLKLLRLALDENPSDANLLMNLGLELVRSDDLAAGVEYYREAFAAMSQQPLGEVVPELREALLTQFTSQLYKLPAYAEVVEVLNSPLAQKDGLTASLHFSLGLAYFELKQFSEAADQMRQCIAKRKQAALTPINTDIHTAAPQHCLALSLARLGDPAAAEKAFLAALSEAGRIEDVKKDYAKFLAETGREIQALEQLNEIVAQNPRNADAWCTGGKITLAKREYLEFARDWTGEAFKALPGSVVIAAQRAEALILNGDIAGALELWEKLWDHEHSPAVLAALILCEAIEKPTTHAPDEGSDELLTSREFISWYQRLLKLQLRPLVERVNEQLEKLARALPTAAQMIESALAEPAVPSQK